MTHAPTPNPIDDTLARMLDAHLAAAGDELTPSSGFAASVMESIHAQVAEPLPIAFPWGRVLPGAIAIVCGLLALVVFAIRAAKTGFAVAPSTGSGVSSHVASFASGQATLVWLLLAACLSIAAIVVSLRLTRHTE
jgi:hypothetical protein